MMGLPAPELRRAGGALAPLLLAIAFVAGCFPRHAGPRLAHFDDLAPPPSAAIPELLAVDLAGQPVRLAAAVRPMVLQVGSVSCPVFRYRRHGMERLVEELGERVDFVVLYTREAHPVGAPSPYTEAEWDPWINRVTGVRVGEATSLDERIARATTVRADLKLSPRVLVDPVGDPGWRALGRAPSAAFVLDARGRVVARQVWVDPPELRRILHALLAAEEATAPAVNAPPADDDGGGDGAPPPRR